ncbi:hypothetical protein L4Z68_001324 [Pseudomonas aeruginosa]|nr:hypothetical protein [Pseudomonas aeruginosa]EKX2969331.1 hypothetical protein [Pseudomonas aeruginosa]
MNVIPEELLSQFPPLPEHEATWQAIYMEPVMCSGERITVAVIAFDRDGCEVLKVLTQPRLSALFGPQADAMSSMIDMVVEAASRQGATGSLEGFQSPLSGVSLGKPREALGDDRADVLQQAASLSSCFFDPQKTSN